MSNDEVVSSKHLNYLKLITFTKTGTSVNMREKQLPRSNSLKNIF